jgi:hypothetical protein
MEKDEVQKSEIVKQILACLLNRNEKIEKKGPVVINEESTTEGVRSEYDHIEKELGEKREEWVAQSQTLVTGPDGKRFDVVYVSTKDGRMHTFCFDITKFYGKKEK